MPRVHRLNYEGRVTEVPVTRTYLEITSREDFKPARISDERVRIERIVECTPALYRYLYRAVGRNYHWTDRLGWTDDEIRAHMLKPGVSLWIMFHGGLPAGYFELEKHGDGSVEIAYIGLLGPFLGRGLGRHLLTHAVERAWESGAGRVWVHTCTLDHPAAMPNYLKRGFRPFREETYTAIVPAERRTGASPRPGATGGQDPRP